ncbi:MAG: SHOCT domain-containing protein [Nannocystaceae bacterium]
MSGEQIHKLDELRRSGILTDAEFEQQKAQVLARM